ncbi:hypothetical protein ACH4YN_38140 [Streptomyces griseofuscus]|uniref:hypothetical protein n=1 Tax=Streptomyces griseofuscus TaxID=146922 RepID=UPI00379FF5F0
MTMTQRARRGVTLTANPSKGVRIERDGSLEMTGAGRFALPLSVTENGAELGVGRLILTYESAAELHAELGRLLVESQDPTTPDERSE